MPAEECVIGCLQDHTAKEGAVVGLDGVDEGVGVDDLLFVVFEAYSVGSDNVVVEEMIGAVGINANSIGAEADVAEEFADRLAIDGNAQSYAGSVDVYAFLGGCSGGEE